MQMVPEIKGRHFFTPRKRTSDLGMLSELAAITGAEKPALPVRNPVGSELLHMFGGMILGALAGGGGAAMINERAIPLGTIGGSYAGLLGGMITGVTREVTQGKKTAEDVRARLARLSSAELKTLAKKELSQSQLPMSLFAGVMGQGSHQSGRASVYQRLLQGKPSDSWSAEALDSPQGGFANMVRARDIREELLK